MQKIKYKKIKPKALIIQLNFVNFRFILLYYCILLALVFLLCRLAYIQIIYSDNLVHQSDMRSLRAYKIPTFRGMITDRFGKPLAVSIPVKAIWVDPKELQKQGGIKLNRRWKALTDALKTSFSKIVHVSTNQKSRFVYLSRQISQDLANYIRELKLPGVHLSDESRRYYPSKEVIAHLIGFTDIDSKGIEGIEKSFDKWLTGYPGKYIVRKDQHGCAVEHISYINSRAAHSLVLSIDERLQTLVYRELNNAVNFNKAESGSAVLVCIDTGEILAMANSPSYNPNSFINFSRESMRNRAITDMFEPGSIVKPMVIMAALEKGIVNKNSVITTIPYKVGRHKIKDVASYGKLNLIELLQKSSNIGISKLALSMPPSVLIDTYSRFGLGKPTNLGLVGECNGVLHSKKQHWTPIERATLSFGYGLMATPLQLARVYATIGSYGIYRPLSITKVNSPILGKRVFSESIVRTVLHMMESVSMPGGSGAKAAIKGYRIAIKTGTVKKVGPNGYYINKYIAYTAGVAPASNPLFSLVVVINNPQAGKYYGGTVSAPVFGTIMDGVLRTLNIKPDAS